MKIKPFKSRKGHVVFVCFNQEGFLLRVYATAWAASRYCNITKGSYEECKIGGSYELVYKPKQVKTPRRSSSSLVDKYL